MKRTLKRMANDAFAMTTYERAWSISFSARFKTKNSSLKTALAVGEYPLARTARWSLLFKVSMAFLL